ncbi:MAG: hypothetical protein LH610_01555 [Sphingomonas bacterium]|nr:hypothetical protein [Sphingomonas bacterium]
MPNEFDPDDVALLLPFYVNGTLGADDRVRVEFALEASVNLRAELEEVQAVAALVHGGGKMIAPNLMPRLDRAEALLARIAPPNAATPDAITLRPVLATPSVQKTWQDRLAMLFAKRWQPALAMCAIAVIVAQGASLYFADTHRAESEYTVASGPKAPATRAQIVLQPDPNANWDALSQLISAESLEVTGSIGGMLTLRCQRQCPADDVDSKVAHLRASSLVAFAGKVA